LLVYRKALEGLRAGYLGVVLERVMINRVVESRDSIVWGSLNIERSKDSAPRRALLQIEREGKKKKYRT